jgi:hypothetical protein
MYFLPKVLLERLEVMDQAAEDVGLSFFTKYERMVMEIQVRIAVLSMMEEIRSFWNKNVSQLSLLQFNFKYQAECSLLFINRQVHFVSRQLQLRQMQIHHWAFCTAKSSNRSSSSILPGMSKSRPIPCEHGKNGLQPLSTHQHSRASRQSFCRQINPIQGSYTVEGIDCAICAT